MFYFAGLLRLNNFRAQLVEQIYVYNIMASHTSSLFYHLLEYVMQSFLMPFVVANERGQNEVEHNSQVDESLQSNHQLNPSPHSGSIYVNFCSHWHEI